ncbi:MAG: T9SS type A sorting domain-containing protein [Calditrichaeota bacterium]|nr:T9SS type A sorting domain-containing protein [Calditrichota bacterium]
MVKAIIVIFLCFATMAAQDSLNYFPHNDGDMWEYYHWDADAANTVRITVKVDSITADSTYFQREFKFIDSPDPDFIIGYQQKYCIADTNHNIFSSRYSYTIGMNRVYKFDVKKDGKYIVTDLNGGYDYFYVWDKYTDTVFNKETEILEIAYYAIDDTARDELGLFHYSDILAEGIGSIKRFGELGDFMTLIGARINGTSYGILTAIDQDRNNRKVPKRFVLEPNYPNPFNSQTQIRFLLFKPDLLSISIFNNQGQLVRNLVQKRMFSAGEHKIKWDSKNNFNQPVASGFYIYTIYTSKYSYSGKMQLIQ